MQLKNIITIRVSECLQIPYNAHTTFGQSRNVSVWTLLATAGLPENSQRSKSKFTILDQLQASCERYFQLWHNLHKGHIANCGVKGEF